MDRWSRGALLALFLARAAAAAPPTVVFLSDFGTRDDAVAACKGVMLQIEPELRVIDLTHHVPPFSVRDGARLLADTAEYYPPGTVFLGVVDPGVGSDRKPMVMRTKRDQYFVVPDNGLATLAAERAGPVEAREVANADWMRGRARASIFQGRDVFAPVAAHLAHGEDWTRAGPPIDAPMHLELPAARLEGDVLRGEVIAIDGPFGNLITNVGAERLPELGWAIGDRVPIEIGKERLILPWAKAFADVPQGAALLYVDSREHIGVALNRGSYAEARHVRVGTPLVIRRKPEAR